MMKHTVLVAALLAACLQHFAAAGPSARGIHPDVLSKYKTRGSTFTCFDGSKKIPTDQINDNFCDCPDGSDEPGTSACPNSTFYCKNHGYEPKVLQSPFVDDGVCDCCDGTDEPVGVCKNMCFEESASIRQELKDKANDIIQAVNKKADLVKEAAQAKADAKQRLGKIDTEIEEADAEVAKLEDEVAQLEEQKRQSEQAAAAAAEAAADSAGPAAEVPADAPGQEGDEASDTVPPIEGAAGDEESAEELGRRIASQWTHDPEAAGAEEHEPDSPLDDTFADDAWHADDIPDHNSPLDQARDRLRDARNRATNLKDEKERLTKTLALDLGPGDLFWHLAGQCLTASDPRFTYEACFYDDASQAEGQHATGGTKIGSWEGFAENYKVAKFANGDWCWEGPNRSFTIDLECGMEVTLHSPAEPSKCVYTAKLKTPAACEPHMAEEMQAEIARLEEMEADFRAQAAEPIIHDELALWEAAVLRAQEEMQAEIARLEEMQAEVARLEEMEADFRAQAAQPIIHDEL